MKKNALLAVVGIMTLLSLPAHGLVNPLNDEAADAYFREKAAENYRRLINERLDNLKNINGLVSANPNPYEPQTQKVAGFFIYLLEPLYVTAILAIGIYLLFVSGSPGARTQAKKHLLILLVAMALVSVSLPAASIILDLSKAATLQILSIAPVDTQAPFNHASNYLLEIGTHITTHEMESGYTAGVERAGTPILFGSYALLETILLALNLRYYIVAVLIMMLPATITLYAFLPTRGIGRLLAENTLLWITSQAAIALVLIVVAVGVELTNNITTYSVPSGLRFIYELAGLVILAITPLIFVTIFSGFTYKKT